MKTWTNPEVEELEVEMTAGGQPWWIWEDLRYGPVTDDPVDPPVTDDSEDPVDPVDPPVEPTPEEEQDTTPGLS